MYVIYYTDYNNRIDVLKDDYNRELLFDNPQITFQVVKQIENNRNFKTLSIIEKETGAILLDIQ